MHSAPDPEPDSNDGPEPEKPQPTLQYWHSDRTTMEPVTMVLAMVLGIPVGAVLVFIPGFILCDKVMEGNITLSQRLLGAMLGAVFLWATAGRISRITRRIRLERMFSSSYRGSIFGGFGVGFGIGISISCLILGLMCLGAAFFG